MFDFTFNLDKPATVRGYIMDSAILSPENSIFTNERDQYSITLELEDGWLYEELEALYRMNTHNALPHMRDWKNSGGAGWITMKSLIEPRVLWPENLKQNKELKRGHLVSVDFRPILKVLDESAFETLVIISINADPHDSIYEFDENAPLSEVEQRLGIINI